MGKTSMPLRLLVEEGLFDTEQITKLRDQGHEVVVIPFNVNGMPADVIFHRHAWNMHPDYMDYLPVALKAARGRRYPKRAKREPKATKKKATKASTAVS